MAARTNGKTAVKAPRKRPKAQKPPADLQGAGRATWDLLHQLPQVIFPGDEPLALRLCRVEDEMTSLRSHLLEQGTILERPIQNACGETIGSDLIAHPALLSLRRCGIEASELCGALGIVPDARHTLGLVVAEREPDNVDMLKERRRKRRVAAEIGV